MPCSSSKGDETKEVGILTQWHRKP
jgi:hypothetical protein